MRVAAAEVDIYIMTLFEAGSETDSAETLSCLHSTAHGWLQRGDMGRASMGYSQACAEMHPASVSSVGCQRQSPVSWMAEGSPLPQFSASAVLSLLLVSLSDGVSPTVPLQLWRNAVRVHEIIA